MLETDKEIIVERRLLYPHFEQFVATQLPQPPLISADDLQEVALAHLGGVAVEDASSHYDRFVEFTLQRIEEFNQGPTLNFGEWAPVGIDTKICYGADAEGIGELPNGFVLRVDFDRESACLPYLGTREK
jgi:hypothetical protein